MNPIKFKQEWDKKGDPTFPINMAKSKGLGLKEDTQFFLENSGLPKSAAPYLSFVINSWDILPLTANYHFLPFRFSRYILIGSDSEGNPIVIDSKQEDKILWLDHDNDFYESFMNTSIDLLAHFILLYRNFVENVLKEGGEDAFFQGNFTDYQFQELTRAMEKLDPEALKEEAFWGGELKLLFLNREAFKKE